MKKQPGASPLRPSKKHELGIALGGMTIGAPIVGWVANNFGPRSSLAVGAGAGFTAALIALYVLARRNEPLLA